MNYASGLSVLIMLVSFGSSKGFAGSCETKDLNASKNSPFRQIPVYDQDGSGTCYAHAAVQLVDYYRINKGESKVEPINPIYAAWNDHYDSKGFFGKRKNTDGGDAASVIMSLKKTGFCKDDQVQKCLKEFKEKGGQLSDSELIRYLEVMEDSYRKIWFKDPKGKTIEKAKLILEKEDSWDKNRCDELSKLLKMKELIGVSTNKILKDLFKDCKKEPLADLPVPNNELYDFFEPDVLRKKIDDVLDLNHPSSISICANFMEDPQYKTFDGKRQNTKNCYAHELLVTGRRKKGEFCQYLLRNSWGANWKPVGVDCACFKKNGDYSDQCENQWEVREYVGCWYSDYQLIPNTFMVTYF